jgi:Beta-propeller repeat/Carboxypeptidase regulatory-like domain/Bacterial pre-peptidase C-terminal domain
MYVVGHTDSVDFPTDPPIQQPSKGLTDVFVTKLSESGALVYSAYIGGSGVDEGWGIAADETGNIHITGNTRSADFPHDQALQAANSGGADAFITKIGPNGDTLVFSTYLGGSGFDQGDGIAVDGAGNIGVSGHTTSKGAPFPNINASQTAFGGGTNDGFVAKLSPDGQVFRYSTYLGGSGDEGESTLALDSAGNAYITGDTTSTNFPTSNPRQISSGGMSDAFVTKLNAAGERLYSTYLGGSGDDYGEAIAVGTTGKVYIAIGTSSTDLPLVANPAQGQNGGYWDAYMATINPSSAGPASLVYSTYLGGSGYDYAKGIAVDDAGNIYVSGNTLSTDFPMKYPIQYVFGGNDHWDIFVAKLDVDLTEFVFSTYLGGSNVDENAGIAVDRANNIYVTGDTNSTNFPTTANPVQPTLHGGYDTFVTKLAPTYTILGHVHTSSGTGVPGITISAGAGQTTITAADGSYTLSGLLAGSYTLAATRQLYTISPKSHAVSVPPAASGQDFIADPSPIYMSLLRTSLPPQLLPKCEDDKQPNDAFGDAQLLTQIGQPCSGSFQNERIEADDWYYVTLTAGQTISIDLTGIAAGADYILGFWRSATDRLKRSDLPGQNDEHISMTVGETGKYYIRISMKTKSSMALNTYVLRVTIA